MSNFLRILCAKIIEIGPLLTELLNHCVVIYAATAGRAKTVEYR